jgi:Ca2+-binding EF-hand superfamily protein
MLTELQRKKLARLFHVLDADHDQLLERDDYDAVVINLAKVRGWPRGSPEFTTLESLYFAIWDDLKRRADTNGDGRVSFREFVEFHDAMLGNRETYSDITEKTVEVLFGAFDRDHDGQITKDDFILFFNAYRISDRETIDESFRRLDVEHTGTLSRDDVYDRVHEYYFSNDAAAAGNWLFGPHE